MNPTATSQNSSTASSVLIERLITRNFLSFGSEESHIPLQALNIIIGPNGSGKSNLIEAVFLLRSTPIDIAGAVRSGGGIHEWVWKGNPDNYAAIGAQFVRPNVNESLSHTIAFEARQQSFGLRLEAIEDVTSDTSVIDLTPYFVNASDETKIRIQGAMKDLGWDSYDLNDSILAQRRDPEQYPEITFIAQQYSRIRIYREWQFGRNTVFRQPQRADMRNDYLEEDFSNLGLFLSRLRRNPETKNTILTNLRDLYEGVDDFDVYVEGGTVQVFFTEGKFTIPATRLSDGTLRYLCLLAILCDPTPPPLICIEEPELGLHPDILPKIADLLVEASTRTQLIVTTHSDILIDAMTERPESVLVCEKHEGQTKMTRLSADDLSEWLKTYRLGQLWMRGEIGGTRW